MKILKLHNWLFLGIIAVVLFILSCNVTENDINVDSEGVLLECAQNSNEEMIPGCQHIESEGIILTGDGKILEIEVNEATLTAVSTSICPDCFERPMGTINYTVDGTASITRSLDTVFVADPDNGKIYKYLLTQLVDLWEFKLLNPDPNDSQIDTLYGFTGTAIKL